MAQSVRPGLGFFRVLAISLNVNDAGLSSGISRASARMALFEANVDKAAASLRTIQTQMAIVGFAAAAVFGAIAQRTAEFEDTLVTASIASGQSLEALRQRSLSLSNSFALATSDAAELTRAVSFLGDLTEEEQQTIAQAGAKLELLGGVQAPEAAQQLKRILQVTTPLGEEADLSAEKIDSLTAAVVRVGGSISTLEFSDILDFIEVFKSAGVASGLTAEEFVALSGTLADLDEQARSVSKTFIQRAFQTDQFELMGQVLGMTASEVRRFRNQNPVEFLQRLGQVLREAEADEQLRNLMEQLDLGQFRSMRPLLLFIANLEKFDSLLGTVESKQENLAFLNDAIARKTETAAFKFQQLTAAVNRMTVAVGSGLVPALMPLIGALTALGDFLGNNRGLAALLGVGAVAGTGLVVGGLAKAAINLARGVPANRSIMAALIKSPQLLRQGAAGFIGRTAVAGASPGAAGAIQTGLLGGGTMARLFGRGLLARAGGFLGSFFGRGAARGVLPFTGALAGRGAGLLLPGVNIAATLSLLTPVFGGLADVLSNLSDEGDVLDLIAEGLSTIFRALELGGRIINETMELIMGAFGFILKRFFGIDVSGATNALGSLNRQLAGANRFLEENRGFGLLPQQNNTVNVNVEDSGETAHKKAKDITKSLGVQAGGARVG